MLFGESLGSYGTEQAFDNVDQMISGVDGALLVGPVFQNHIHNDVTDARDKGSPFWRPVYQQGEHVRFAVAPSDLSQPATEWKSPRIVYLQNSSDPITYWSLDLIWNRPEWLDDPRGPDVSSHMFWAPDRDVLEHARRHGVLDRRSRRPRPRLRRESGRRVGGDRPAAGLDAGEDPTSSARSSPTSSSELERDERADVGEAVRSRCARRSARRGCPTAAEATRTATPADRRDRDRPGDDSRRASIVPFPLASLSAGGRCQRPNTTDDTTMARRRVPDRSSTPSSTPRKIVSSNTTVPSGMRHERLEHALGRRVGGHVVALEVGARAGNRDQHDDHGRDEQGRDGADPKTRADVRTGEPELLPGQPDEPARPHEEADQDRDLDQRVGVRRFPAGS